MTIYIAGSGQSNAEGRGTGGSFDISPLVKVWNNYNGVSDLTHLGTAWIDPVRGQHPLDVTVVGGGNNMLLQAANKIALATGEDVRLVLVTKGGIDIGQWYSASTIQPMLARLLAVLSAVGVGMLDGFFWHQGESDDASSLSSYQGRWNAVLREIGNAGHIGATTPIVMGECSVSHKGSNSLIVECATGPVLRAPISKFPTSEGTHFTGDALVGAGAIYAALFSL